MRAGKRCGSPTSMRYAANAGLGDAFTPEERDALRDLLARCVTAIRND